MSDHPLTRAQQAGTCPNGGEHEWLDVTVLTDCGRAAKYACGRCTARAEEAFVKDPAND